MKNEKYLDHDYYYVEMVNNVKCVGIYGYFYCAGETFDEDEPDKIYRSVEVSMDPMPIADFKKIYESGNLWDFLSENEQYTTDLTEDEADAAMEIVRDGNSAHGKTELPLSNLTENTPCGNYIDCDDYDKNGYIKTDDLQWAKKLNEDEYALVEVRTRTPDDFVFVAGSIDLNDYTEEDITSVIKGYGYDNIQTVKDNYGDGYKQIIAECLFEMTPCEELIGFGPYDTEDIAETHAIEYIKVQ